MNHADRYETEIDLKDLLFYILYKWRSILLAAAVLCLLLGGYKFCSNMTGDGETTKEVREYEIALAEYEFNKTTYEQEILDNQELLRQQKIYMEESILMQIDPYEKPTASADFFVKLDKAEWEMLPDSINLDPTDSLLKAYTSSLVSHINWEPIEELTGQESRYLKETLDVWADYNSNTFTVSVVYFDGDMAQRILDIIAEQILAKYQDISTNVSKHTITVIGCSLSYNIDSSLADTQKENADILLNYGIVILDYQKKLEVLEEPVAPSRAAISCTKYAALGFAAGVLLMAIFHGLAYLLGGKLHGEWELKDRYGYRLLGMAIHTEKGSFLPVIDRLLGRLEGKPQRMGKDETYSRISVNLMNLAGKHQKLLMTGTVDAERLHGLASSVSPLLNDITLSAAADMNKNADTLMALADFDGVILVEELGKSRISEIQREHECITALNKPVVGYVLL